MKSLNLAIKLLHRYLHHEYDTYRNKHIKKWGDAVDHFKKEEGLYTWDIKYPKAKTESSQKQAFKEMVTSIELDDRMQERDLNRAYRIIMKYNSYWWD